MATNIGPKIGIEGEAEYRKQIQQIVQSQKTLKAEMTATAEAFAEDASNKEKSAAKTKILEKQIAASNAKLQEQEHMLQESARLYGETDKRTLAWKETVERTKAEIAGLNKELKENSGVVAFGKDLQEAGQKMQDVGGKISAAGSTLTKSITAPLAAAGVAAIKLATDFETSIAKLNSIADTSEKPISQLTDEIMKLSEETGIAASEISEQAYQAISAGQSTANAVNFVSNATKLARAGFAETGQALDVLTTILNAYGKSGAEAGAVSDRLIQTQNLGKVTVAQLAESMGKAIPTAASFNVNLDNVAATYVTLTKQGINSAVATTQLNGIMNQLGKSGTKAANALKDKTGKTFKELMGEGYSLADVLGILQEAAEEEGVALTDMFGNVRAAAGATAIMNDAGKTFNETLKSMATATGTTDKAFKKVTDTTAFRFEKSLNQVKNAGIQAGQQLIIVLGPAIEKVAGLIERGTKAFDSMTKQEQQAILKTLGFAAAIGPTVQLIGGLTTGVGKTTAAVGKMIEAFGLTGSVPVTAIMAVVAASAALYAGFKLLSNKSLELNKEFLNNAKETQKLAESSAELRKEVESSASAYKETTKNLEVNERRADALVDTIEELSGKTNRSEAEERKLAAAVEELNGIYPSLNLQIDTQTGALNKSNREIRDNVKALAEQARVQAAQERAVEINKKIIETEIKLEELHGKEAQTAEAAASARARLAQETKDLGVITEQTKTIVNAAEEAEKSLTSEIAEQETSLQGLQNELQVTEGYLTTHGEALTETQSKEEQAKESVDQTSDAFEDEAQAAEDAALRILEAATLQAGAFEKVEQAQTQSIQDMIAGLQSQVEAQQNYRQNLETLYAYIEQDSQTNWDNLLHILIDGGISMAGELQGIVDAIEKGDTDALAELANLTTGIGSETTKSADALGELAGLADQKLQDTEAVIKKASPKIQTEAKLAAQNMKPGFKAGANAAAPVMMTDAKTSAITKPAAEITRNKGQIQTAAQNAASAMSPGFKSGASAAAAGMSADAQKAAVTDPAAAISSNKGQLQLAAQDAASGMGPGFKLGASGASGDAKSAAAGVVDAGKKGFSENKGSLETKAKEVGTAGGKAFSQGAKDTRGDAESAGKYVAEGYAVGLKAKEALLEQRARELAWAANRAFKNAEMIKSPSKVTRKLGEYVGEGYAIGIENEIGRVKAAATLTAKAANAALGRMDGSRYMDLPEAGIVDPDALYAAVRAGAADAVPKVYLNGRDLTRSLQNMGVSFTYG